MIVANAIPKWLPLLVRSVGGCVLSQALATWSCLLRCLMFASTSQSSLFTKHMRVLKDLDCAFPVVNVILFLYKNFQTDPESASKRIFFRLQTIYSLCVASKFRFKARSASNGYPNGGTKLPTRASLRVRASGRENLEPTRSDEKF